MLWNLALVAAAGLALAGLAAGRGWQDSVRAAWGLPSLETFAPVRVAVLAFAVFVLLLLIGRLFGRVRDRLSAAAGRALPTRAAQGVGLLAAAALVLLVLNGVLLRGLLRMVDETSPLTDTLIATDMTPPPDPAMTGSRASLVPWEDPGSMGRD